MNTLEGEYSGDEEVVLKIYQSANVKAVVEKTFKCIKLYCEAVRSRKPNKHDQPYVFFDLSVSRSWIRILEISFSASKATKVGANLGVYIGQYSVFRNLLECLVYNSWPLKLIIPLILKRANVKNLQKKGDRYTTEKLISFLDESWGQHYIKVPSEADIIDFAVPDAHSPFSLVEHYMKSRIKEEGKEDEYMFIPWTSVVVPSWETEIAFVCDFHFYRWEQVEKKKIRRHIIFLVNIPSDYPAWKNCRQREIDVVPFHEGHCMLVLVDTVDKTIEVREGNNEYYREDKDKIDKRIQLKRHQKFGYDVAKAIKNYVCIRLNIRLKTIAFFKGPSPGTKMSEDCAPFVMKLFDLAITIQSGRKQPYFAKDRRDEFRLEKAVYMFENI